MRGMEPVEGVTSPCPVCGTPRPIDGADRAHCVACGEDREVPPLVLEAARAYRRASANLPLQLTQTSDLGALARTADDDYQRFRRFMTIAAIPAVILFVLGVGALGFWSPDYQRNRIALVPPLVAPMAALLVQGAWMRRRWRRRSEDVIRLLSARALADAPGTLGCRMCGAPLEASLSAGATARCRYCRSESIVTPRLSEEAASVAFDDYGRLATQVLASAARNRPNWILGAVMPMVALVVAGWAADHAVRALERWQLPFRPSVAYTLNWCPSNPSRRWVESAGSKPLSCYNSRVSWEEQEKQLSQPLDPARLHGQLVLRCYQPHRYAEGPFRAVGLLSDGLLRNKVELDVDEGGGRRGQCFVDRLELSYREP